MSVSDAKRLKQLEGETRSWKKLLAEATLEELGAQVTSFAVNAIRRWWRSMGRARYPQARRLLITADCGGSNGARVRLWKRELQALGQRTWPGHHRLPSAARHQQMEPDRASSLLIHHTELAWQAAGQLPDDRAADRATTTRTGLQVQCAIDDARYPAGVKVSDAEMADLKLTPHEFHGEWDLIAASYRSTGPQMTNSMGSRPRARTAELTSSRISHSLARSPPAVLL